MSLKSLKRLVKDLRVQAAVRNVSAPVADANEPPSDIADTLGAADVRILWPEQYHWPLAIKWVGPLMWEFDRVVPLVRSPIPQPYSGVTVFTIEAGGRSHRIAIDYADRTPINRDCASEVLVYFKMQFDDAGYGLDNVVPGGFVPADSSLYEQLGDLRRARETQPPDMDVYGRFGAQLGRDVRVGAMRLLGEQSRFRFEGGLKKVSYRKSLQEVARSKVCIDLPGNGPLCFRLVEYLAVGACVVAYPHKARLPVSLTDRVNIVYCKEDLSDLVELCDYYIHHPQERSSVGNAARDYFDRHLHRRHLARYYLKTILTALEG